jgi:hypothetical protein
MSALTPASENKDSPYSQRFQKERGMKFEFIKKYKNITHLHNLDLRYMTSLSYSSVFDLTT